MSVLHSIKERLAYYADSLKREPRSITQSIITRLEYSGAPSVVVLDTTLITCKDCKHGHITIDGNYCKWCSIMATHQIDSDEYVDPPNGYDPEPYFDADFFCGYAERREL